jgi:acyl-CoA hydrolase
MMAWVDEAGGIFAREYTNEPRMVTVLFEKFEFHKAVHVSDIVNFFADNPRIGETSLTFDVIVKKQNGDQVVSTTCVFVCVDEDMKRTKHLLKRDPNYET